MTLLLLALGCAGPDDCAGDTVWSPEFEQCIGAEEAPTPTTTPEPTTGDTGADTASSG